MAWIAHIDWTEKSIAHIARHNVIPKEVEEGIFDDAPHLRIAKIVPTEPSRTIVYCQRHEQKRGHLLQEKEEINLKKVKKSEEFKELESVDEIPKKFNFEEESEFWDTHSFGTIADEMPVSDLIPRRKKRMCPVSIRLPEDIIRDAKKISASENVDYTALLRQIVVEGVTLVKKRRTKSVKKSG